MYKCPGNTTEEDDAVEEEYTAVTPLRILPLVAVSTALVRPTLLLYRGRKDRATMVIQKVTMATRETTAVLLMSVEGGSLKAL